MTQAFGRISEGCVDSIKSNISSTTFIFSHKNLADVLLSKQTEILMNIYRNLIGDSPIKMRALIFFDDISGDLLGIDTFANTNLMESFEYIKDIDDVSNKMQTIVSSLKSIETKYKLDQVYKFSYLAITFKRDNIESNIILMPVAMSEVNQNSGSNSLNDFIKMMSTQNDFSRNPDLENICKNSEGLSFIWEQIPGSKLFFFLYLGSSPKSYQQAIPLLNMAQQLRKTLKINNFSMKNYSVDNLNIYAEKDIRNYSKNLIHDIVDFMKEIQPILVIDLI